jgi:hypothetical protein
VTRGCIPGLAQTFRLYNFPPDGGPVEGDILRKTSTGSCYLIEEIRPGREPGRYVAEVVGLGVDAADEGAPGVWRMT